MDRATGTPLIQSHIDVIWESADGGSVRGTEKLLAPFFAKPGEWYSPFYWIKQTFEGPKKIHAPAFVQVIREAYPGDGDPDAVIVTGVSKVETSRPERIDRRERT